MDTMDTIEYISVRSAALKKGLRPGTVYNRMRKLGWSPEKALSKPAVSDTTRKIREIAARGDLVVPAQLAYQRMVTLGWDADRAAKMPLRDRSLFDQYEYKGQKYTIAELEAISGVPRTVISHRVNSLKWSVDRALAVSVKKRQGKLVHKTLDKQ